jgi:hypothetical protein
MMSLRNILDELVEHKEEVLEKLQNEGSEEQAIAMAYVFNFAADIKLKEIGSLGYNDELKIKREFPIIPLTMVSGRSSISAHNIDKFEMGAAGMSFLDENERRADMEDFVEKDIIRRLLPQIKEAKQEMIDKVNAIRLNFENYKSEMETKFAKVLIAKKFKDEQEKEKW